MQIANCKLQIEQPREIRRGVTLMELLIVISILVLLVAVAIPAMQPALEGRRIREAARAINVYVGSARNRAKELGRPCGVVIERFDTLPQCSMVLTQAEVPPPYAGDLMDSVVRLQDWTIVNSNYRWLDRSIVLKVSLRFNQQDFSNGLVRYGDTMQINHQGPFYTVVEDTANGGSDPADYPPDPNGFLDFTAGQDNDPDGWIDTHVLTLVRAPSPGQAVPWPRADTDTWSAPMPFEIFRQPVTSAATPLQLPAGAVIDLEYSGSEDHSIGAGTGAPVYIMFSPNGSLERVYHRGHHHSDMHLATEPLFLLIGKRERVGAGPLGAAPTEEELPNWIDPTNLWVTLNPQTGLVTTTENFPVEPASVDWTQPDTWSPHIKAARQFAREAQSMGGR